ncbi:hypothetical protein L9F63_013943, partial [Diploptera punctata]
MHEYYGSDVPKIIHMSCNSISDCICLAFDNGDILTFDRDLKEVECVGCVENGLKVVQWSPDQEIIIMITGLDTIIVMTGTFDPIIETDLHQSGFGEKQFITVGWGKKETQFHGSEGKAAARAVPKSVDQVSVLDDGKPQISWRGDGTLFAVSVIKPETNIRQIRIFSRDGVLQYTSETVIGLEGALSWRPSGNLIATSQRLPNKHIIAFFEKNGLRHGEFSLPFGQNECKINQLLWNSESSILAVWGEYITGNSFLQLWTTSNYHWYLKQNLNFPAENKLLALEWDMLIGNRLHVLCKGLLYLCYEWGWTVSHSLGNKENDEAFVAVIDGGMMVKSRERIVPPPMCSETLNLPVPINHIIFSPPADSAPMCSPLFAIWNVQGVTSYVVNLSLDVEEQKIKVGREIAVDGVIVSMVMRSDGTALIQKEGGALYTYKPDDDDLVSFQKSLPETCETLKVCHVDDRNVFLGLSKRNRLYVDGEEVANNVTSLVIHSEFILLTTLKHELLCAQLNKKGLQSLREGKCGPGRRIERGARLITSVSGDTRVLLQMPRGNLECIQPRPLTLHVATVHLDNKRYRAAFELLRKNRINLNLLCDYQPQIFLNNVDDVINEIKDPLWLSLFLSELQNENVVHTMYKDYYIHLDNLPNALTNKVQVVCDTVRESLLSREDADEYLLPVLTSFVQKKTDKDLADALLKVKAVREAEKNTGHSKVSADEALKYLLYLVDVNQLYDVALGLYDFDLVMMVTAKSNKDPKEYLPFLNELRSFSLFPEIEYLSSYVYKHLKRYKSALTHIALCPEEEKFGECLKLVKSHKLYSQALGLFPKRSSRYFEIASLYGDYLIENRQYHEAGIMYTRAEKHQKALTAYLQAGDWRETLFAARQLQYKENRLHELCQDIVSRLKSRHRYMEAAEVLNVHMGDIEESISVMVQGKLWNETLCNLLHNSLTIQEPFTSLPRTELSTVRTIKGERTLLEEKEGDILEDCDLYSDTSRKYNELNFVNPNGTLRSSRSSKNKRKQERKMLSLKEGSPYEEYALVRELHQLITNAYNTTDEVVGLCRVLLKFEKDKEAADLQKILSSMLRNMDSAKQEIWITDLMQQSQIGYGPDATVNSITARLQTNGPSNPDLSLLGSHVWLPLE